jgi:hypothetical protein
MLVMIFMPPGVPANCQHGWEIPELNGGALMGESSK